MADLGAIGIRPVSIAALAVPMNVSAATGTILGISPFKRVVFDCADAKSVAKNFPRAVELRAGMVLNGRTALYLASQLQIRGTVKNSAGTGISRRVLIINREGACVGKTQSAGDGTFTITLFNQSTNPVLCVAIPDDGDIRNAVVKWKVLPVAQA